MTDGSELPVADGILIHTIPEGNVRARVTAVPTLPEDVYALLSTSPSNGLFFPANACQCLFYIICSF